MRIVLQRVSKASVTIETQTFSAINSGYLLLLGIENDDTQQDITWLCGKISKMRLFSDKEGKMNLSIKDISGEVLVVSQFTLYASIKKGNRPSFIKAARPEIAIPLYQQFIATLENELEKPVATGKFGAMMDVQLINDGPVTIVIDSKNKA